MAATVASFLCPSDGELPPSTLPNGTLSGPTNYHFCTGDGSPGSAVPGDAGATVPAKGAFVLGRAQSMAAIRDGSSGTAAASEQLLGTAAGGPSTQSGGDPAAPGRPPRRRRSARPR